MTEETFRQLYEINEENPHLHQVVKEVADIEAEADAKIKEIGCMIGQEAADMLDTLFGRLARAYEQQGFLFALNCMKSIRTNDRNEAETAADVIE